MKYMQFERHMRAKVAKKLREKANEVELKVRELQEKINELNTAYFSDDGYGHPEPTSYAEIFQEEIAHCFDDKGNFISKASDEDYKRIEKKFEEEHFIPCREKKKERDSLILEANEYFIYYIQNEIKGLRRKWRLP